jgi:long-chain acyl-CoA synthetase
VQPTVIVGVPRIFEKIYFGIKAQVEISKLKQGLFSQALEIGKTNTELRLKKKTPSFLQAIKSQLAYQMVFSQIQEKLGGRLRFAVSGGAPLDKEIADFFSNCGISILEGYGLTESTGPIFVNTLFQHKNGCVGRAIGDVEVKFDTDGEILIKSKKIMTGYYNNEEETKKVFTEDGYFRTGDIGALDSEGFLEITDRKKDLIKTAGGKFIAPQKIQSLFTQNPLIGHVHIHGDKQKYVVALLTLEKDELYNLRKDHHIANENFAELSQHEKIQKLVRNAVSQANSKLASFETIKRYKVLDHEFTIEKGHLTPSLKMKRQKIDQMYNDDLKELYL